MEGDGAMVAFAAVFLAIGGALFVLARVVVRRLERAALRTVSELVTNVEAIRSAPSSERKEVLHAILRESGLPFEAKMRGNVWALPLRFGMEPSCIAIEASAGAVFVLRRDSAQRSCLYRVQRGEGSDGTLTTASGDALGLTRSGVAFRVLDVEAIMDAVSEVLTASTLLVCCRTCIRPIDAKARLYGVCSACKEPFSSAHPFEMTKRERQEGETISCTGCRRRLHRLTLRCGGCGAHVVAPSRERTDSQPAAS